MAFLPCYRGTGAGSLDATHDQLTVSSSCRQSTPTRPSLTAPSECQPFSPPTLQPLAQNKKAGSSHLVGSSQPGRTGVWLR